MIEHLEHARIDRTEWDAALRVCHGPVWYARSAVLDIACPGWDGLVDRSDGSLMALPWRRRFGIRYLYSPFLLQRLGAFAPTADPTRSGRYLHAVPERFRYVDIGVEGTGPWPGCRTLERANVELVLDRTADEHFAAYSTGHRRNVRKAERMGVEVDQHLDPFELEAFLVGSEQFRRWRIKADALRAMSGLIALSAQEGNGLFLGAKHAGKLVAAAVLVNWAGRLIFLKGLSDAAGREVCAMHALLHTVVREHAGTGTVLDMAGSDQPDLQRFYLGFGAERHGYSRALANRLPLLVRRLKP